MENLALPLVLLFLFPVVMTVLPSLASAGTITLTSTVTIKKDGPTVAINLVLQHSGDVAAEKVTATASLFGEQISLRGPEEVLPGSSGSYVVVLPEFLNGRSVKEGNYPVYIAVSYVDDRGVEHFSPSSGQLVTREHLEPLPVKIELGHAVLLAQVSWGVRIKNLSDNKLPLRLSPYSGPQVQFEPEQAQVLLEPREELSLSFLIRNIKGKAASTIPVFLIAEADEGPLHRTLLQSVALDIASDETPKLPKETVWRYTQLFLFVAALLITVGLVMSFFLIRRQK